MLNLIQIEEERYKQIANYVYLWHDDGQKIASWGAGKKGDAFVSRIDPDNTIIDYIFDKDADKLGACLTKGHRVFDYRTLAQSTDVVFIPDASIVCETAERLKSVGFHGNIISVNDWLLKGSIPIRYDIKEKNIVKVRTCQISALVILYEPEPLVATHIASYADDVDWIYVWDNSLTEHRNMFDNITYKGKMNYFWHGTNNGIGKPVNHVVDLAWSRGFDWLLVFDQDSCAGFGMVEAMRAYAEGDLLDENNAIIAPYIIEPISTSSEQTYLDSAPYLSYIRHGITSGSMHRVDVLRELRYREDFFIDQLDLDYCARVYLSGFNVARLNHVSLAHQQDAGSFEVHEAEGIRFYYGKYSPARYYYQYRNLLYNAAHYAEVYPFYANCCRQSLQRLDIMAVHDKNRMSNERAICCAKRDFEAGLLGRWQDMQ